MPLLSCGVGGGLGSGTGKSWAAVSEEGRKVEGLPIIVPRFLSHRWEPEIRAVWPSEILKLSRLEFFLGMTMLWASHFFMGTLKPPSKVV